MVDHTDLIARLLTMYSHRGDGIPTQYVNPDGPDAVAALESLSARERVLREAMQAIEDGEGVEQVIARQALEECGIATLAALRARGVS